MCKVFKNNKTLITEKRQILKEWGNIECLSRELINIVYMLIFNKLAYKYIKLTIKNQNYALLNGGNYHEFYWESGVT
jgi:hypothetical protein